MFIEMLQNGTLIAALVAWFIAQFVKPFFRYARTRRWNWGLWFSSGGMPSSHSALMSSTALSVGLFEGFDSAAFAISVAIMMIVVYDAAGVRRQAGMHAERINRIINELLSGHAINEQELKEVIGHTPRQVIFGVILGVLTALGVWTAFQ